MSKPDLITVSSSVSARTGEAFVTIHWGDYTGQLPAAEARKFALDVLHCAFGAEYDAAVVNFLGGVESPEALGFLSALRVRLRGSNVGSGAVSASLEDVE